MSADPERALLRVGLDPSDVVLEDVLHNRALTAGIWKVATSGEEMILKCFSAGRPTVSSTWDAHWTAEADDPRRWNYWAREGLAYLNGVTTSYDMAGIVAPRLIAAHQRDEEFVLLLEFVNGVPAEQWSINEYGFAAAALGRAQARWVDTDESRSPTWLSRGYLRQYSSEKPVDWSLLESDAAWAQPLVERNFPPELRAAAIALHAQRDRLYAIAEQLPRTRCHLDFWTKNLILRNDGTVVLLDWAFVGDGAIGEDIGNLVPDTAFDHFLPASDLPDLRATVLANYTQGMLDEGWDDDPRLIELGTCVSAIKYDWLTPFMLGRAGEQQQLRYGGSEPIDADYRFTERGVALLHNARTGLRALELAAHLTL